MDRVSIRFHAFMYLGGRAVGPSGQEPGAGRARRPAREKEKEEGKRRKEKKREREPRAAGAVRRFTGSRDLIHVDLSGADASRRIGLVGRWGRISLRVVESIAGRRKFYVMNSK